MSYTSTRVKHTGAVPGALLWQQVRAPNDENPDGNVTELMHLECALCERAFRSGDWVALVLCGPGGDEGPDGVRAKARRGDEYECHALVIHALCAGLPSLSREEGE